MFDMKKIFALIVALLFFLPATPTEAAIPAGGGGTGSIEDGSSGGSSDATDDSGGSPEGVGESSSASPGASADGGSGDSTSGTADYTLLEPLPTLETETPDLNTYLSGIYTLLIGVAGVLAVFMILLGGIELIFAAVPSARTDAKNRILYASGGLFLALVAWILLNTINPALLEPGLDLRHVGSDEALSGEAAGSSETQYCFPERAFAGGRTGEYSCFETREECENNKDLTSSVEDTCEEYNNPPVASSEFNEQEQQVRSELNGANINVVSSSGGGPCSGPYVDGVENSCTNVFGFNETGMTDAIIDFKNSCDNQQGSCNVVVTGGTEGGHQTHGINKRVVDFRFGDNLDAFLQSGENITTDSGNTYQVRSGMRCNRESDHWHCYGDGDRSAS